MDKFLQQLIDLVTVESNNGDYYVDGYVYAGAIADLINEHFDLDVTFENTYCRWSPRVQTEPPVGAVALIPTIYAEHIKRQLQKDANILKFMLRKEGE